MKKLKNLLLALLSVACVGTMAVGFVGCTDEDEQDSSSFLEMETSSSDTSSEIEDRVFCNGVVYTLNADGSSYSVNSGNGVTQTEIVIYESINGLPVTAIANKAFYGYHELLRVEIPDGITTIGDSAFEGCNKLKDLELPNALTFIGNAAFSGCTCLIGLSIPDSVTSIGESAFYFCQDLTSVKIPEGITSIKAETFEGCWRLMEAVIPNSVTTIGEKAFENCCSLTSITIPDSVVSMGEEAFAYCYALTAYCEAISRPDGWNAAWNTGISYYGTVVWDCNNNKLAENGYIYTVIDGLRYGIKDGKAIVLRQPRNLVSANIPRSIVYEDVNYTVEGIGSSAFSNCWNLTSVTLPDTITFIDSYAFNSCEKLAKIVIPYSTKRMGWSIFWGCGKMVVYCESQQKGEEWDENWNGGCPVVWDYMNNDVANDGYIYMIVEGLRYGIKNGVAEVVEVIETTDTKILNNIVYNDAQYNVVAIQDNAFINCMHITALEIPEGITSIGNYAFAWCHNLKRITLPNSLTKIGDYAFENDGELLGIKLFDNVTSISESAFSGCVSLMDIQVDENNSAYKSIDGNLYSKDGTRLIQYALGKKASEFIVPSGVVTIDNYAFHGASNLWSVVIPDGVVRIGDSAFNWCSELTEIIIPDSVTTIGADAFYGTGYYDEENNWENGALYIGKHLIKVSYTFEGEYKVKDGVLSIADRAFYICSGLTGIIIDSDNICYQSIDGNLYSKDGTVLIQYALAKTATEFVIPDSVTTIGDYVFYDCDSLTSVVIGDSVTTIGEWAFYDCSSLTNVVIPDSVTTIDNYAFYYCSSLTNVVIPDSVTTIDDDAFHYCSSLTSITFEGTVEEWNAIEKGEDWNLYVPATEVVCSDGTVSLLNNA